MTHRYGHHDDIHAAATAITAARPSNPPRIAVILGTGLAPVAHALDKGVVIPYAELPGFPTSTAPGHFGRLHVGSLHGVGVAVLQGRFHLYEGHQPQCWLTPIRALKRAGVETIVITNAVGGFHAEWPSTCLMLVRDHINGLAGNPLVGPNDDAFGVRFPDMTHVYDDNLRARAHTTATELGITLHEGIYYAMLGPMFETPAEIRMMRMLGADVVGMSLVPEAITARHAGMKVLAISAITNHAAGINPNPLTQEEVIEGGKLLSRDLANLITALVPKLV